MFDRDRIRLVLLLASLASGPASAVALPSESAATTDDLALLALDAHPPFASPLLPCAIVRTDELSAATEQLRAELHTPCALGLGDLATVWRAPATPLPMPDDHAPSRADEELFEQLLAEAPDFGSSSPESGAVTTILIGLLLLWAAGPLGRLVSGLETPRRPRRADDPRSQD